MYFRLRWFPTILHAGFSHNESQSYAGIRGDIIWINWDATLSCQRFLQLHKMCVQRTWEDKVEESRSVWKAKLSSEQREAQSKLKEVHETAEKNVHSYEVGHLYLLQTCKEAKTCDKQAFIVDNILSCSCSSKINGILLPIWSFTCYFW